MYDKYIILKTFKLILQNLANWANFIKEEVKKLTITFFMHSDIKEILVFYFLKDLTSNLYFWLAKLVLCFCQKLSGLIICAAWIEVAKCSCKTLRIGFTSVLKWKWEKTVFKHLSK